MVPDYPMLAGELRPDRGGTGPTALVLGLPAQELDGAERQLKQEVRPRTYELQTCFRHVFCKSQVTTEYDKLLLSVSGCSQGGHIWNYTLCVRVRALKTVC